MTRGVTNVLSLFCVSLTCTLVAGSASVVSDAQLIGERRGGTPPQLHQRPSEGRDRYPQERHRHRSVTLTSLATGKALGRVEQPDAHQEVHDAVGDAKGVVDTVKNVDKHVKRGEGVIQRLWHRFLPGFRPSWTVMLINASLVGAALAWFGVYFTFLVHADRHEGRKGNTSGEHSEKMTARGSRAVNEISKRTQPDLVFVFHHPEFERTDAKAATSPAAFDRIVVQDKEKSFGRLKALFDLGKSDPEGTTMASAREALLEDFYELVASKGFTLWAFSSVDDDELFVCVALDEKDTEEYYIKKLRPYRQVKKSLGPQLGLDQPIEELASQPPYVRYDLAMVESLHRAGVIKENDKNLVYARFKDKRTSMLRESECVRIIHHEVSRRFNLDAAVAEGLMVCWYPAFSEHGQERLQSEWGCWSYFLDFSFVQPVRFIRNRLGSRFALFVGWNGFYCKAFLGLLPVTLLVWLGSLWYGSVQLIGCFTFILVIWARVARNCWHREAQFFHALFDDKTEKHDLFGGGTVEPSFHGEKLPSPADLNSMERQYPAYKYFTKRLVSNLVTLLFGIMVFLFIFVWKSVFHGRMGIVSSMCLCLQIKIFQFIFTAVMEVLVSWENHKYSQDKFRSYVWKKAIFESVNNYSAFIFLAVHQAPNGVDDGCPHGHCLSTLRYELSIMLVILTLFDMAENVARVMWTKFLLWHEKYTLRKRAEAEGVDMPVRDFLEAQSKFAPFTTDNLLDKMLGLTISLGHVLIFGALAPVAVPLSFANFVFHLRANAIMTSHYRQRFLPEETMMLDWEPVVSLLMTVGVAFSGFALVAYGELFQGARVFARVISLLLFVVVIQIVIFIVDDVIQPHDATTNLLRARRSIFERRLFERAQLDQEQKIAIKTEKKHCSIRHASDVDKMASRRFSEIAHFDGSYSRGLPEIAPQTP